jgi:glutamate synthase (NADPH) large chain
MQTDIVVETAEPREVMHFALLFGFGANAVNPYLAFAILNQQIKSGDLQLDFHTAEKNYIKAVNKGLLKGNVENGYFNNS